MKGFPGFPSGKVQFTPLPNLFFTRLLPAIDDLAELKVTLHIFWLLHRKRGYPRCVSLRELEGDGVLLAGLKGAGHKPQERLRLALERAVARGTLLHVTACRGEERDDWYFMNTDAGRRAVEKIRRGELKLEGTVAVEAPVEVERPNIFTLYEQNIGLLQPLIAEELREAEETYPAHWIEDAFRIAVEHNARRWSYIRKILERWESEGKDDGKLRRDYRENGRSYLEDEYIDRILH